MFKIRRSKKGKRYVTGEFGPKDTAAIEFMIAQFKEKNPEVTQMSFITWCVRNTVQELFNEYERQLQQQSLPSDKEPDGESSAGSPQEAHGPL